MVVNRDCFILLLIVILNTAYSGCSTNPDYLDFSNKELDNSSTWVREDSFFSSPMASITNMGNYSDQSKSFTISKPTKVHIYAVGESFQSLADNQKSRFLKGDEIEIDLLKSGNQNTPKASTVKLMVAHDTVDKRFPGLLCKWSKTKYSYSAEIKIPLSSVPSSDLLGSHFNIKINDNDDTYIQKAQVSLFKNNESDGGHFLKEKQKNTVLDLLNKVHASKMSIVIDGKIEDNWLKTSAVPIPNVSYGRVRSALDLTASVKFAYDDKNLYLLVEVVDGSIIRLNEAEKRDKISFVDFGWLEDSNQKMVWEMDYLKTKWAGGAIKNQKTDSVLLLPPGTYTLRYKTDELHAFGKWDDEPPHTSFYGIVIYDL